MVLLLGRGSPYRYGFGNYRFQLAVEALGVNERACVCVCVYVCAVKIRGLKAEPSSV